MANFSKNSYLHKLNIKRLAVMLEELKEKVLQANLDLSDMDLSSLHGVMFRLSTGKRDW